MPSTKGHTRPEDYVLCTKYGACRFDCACSCNTRQPLPLDEPKRPKTKRPAPRRE